METLKNFPTDTVECKSRFIRAETLAAASGLAFTVFLAAIAVLPLQALQARPIYARQTGLPCGQCHVNPAGGGPRNAFGRAFAARGHRLPGGTRSSPGHGYYDGMMGDCCHGMMSGHGGMMGGYDRR
jgi:hypothetical protein